MAVVSSACQLFVITPASRQVHVMSSRCRAAAGSGSVPGHHTRPFVMGSTHCILGPGLCTEVVRTAIVPSSCFGECGRAAAAVA
jgi:hypothetical protein